MRILNHSLADDGCFPALSKRSLSCVVAVGAGGYGTCPDRHISCCPLDDIHRDNGEVVVLIRSTVDWN